MSRERPAVLINGTRKAKEHFYVSSRMWRQIGVSGKQVATFFLCPYEITEELLHPSFDRVWLIASTL